MQIGINAMSTIDAMRKDFAGTVRRLHDGGCAYIEAMSDWGARKETLEFYAGLTGGPGGWDPENTLKRLKTLQALDMSIPGIFIFDDLALLREQAEELGAYCRDAGIGYVVLSFREYGGVDEIYEKIAALRKLAGTMGRYGVRVLLHNHEHDLARVTDRDGTEKQIRPLPMKICA